jgi:hypothetical protein
MGVLAALLVAALGGAAGALLFLLMGGWLLGWRLPDTDVLLAIFTGLLVLFALLQYRVSRDVHLLTNTSQRPWINLETLHLTTFLVPPELRERLKQVVGPTITVTLPATLVGDVFSRDSFAANQPIRVVLGFRNSGGTPAFVVDAAVGCSVLDVPVAGADDELRKDGLDFSALPAGTGYPRVLVAGETTNWRSTLRENGLTDDEYVDLLTGKKTLIVWGQIGYQQNRHRGPRLETKFARVYDPTVEKASAGARFAFPDLPGANDAT